MTTKLTTGTKILRSATLLALLWLPLTTSGAVKYLIPLQAEEHQIGNKLEWATSSEMNSHHFVIEKSTDGIVFENIGSLEAAGISGEEKAYRFLDVGVHDTKAFYRLKQTDLDGMFEYSQTVLLNKSLSNQFMVVSMSNTAFRDEFNITVDVITDALIDFKILDFDGNLIKVQREVVTYGLNDIRFDFSEEQDGFYKLIVQLKEEEESLVIQKLDLEAKKRENMANKRKYKGG